MTELTNSSETSETPAPPAEQAAREKLAAALREDESPGDADESPSEAKPQEGKPKGKPKALKDLAERLELKPEDLYAIEVPMSDGKSATLGALKDSAAKQDDLTVRELAFAERVSKQEAEWTRAQTEFQALVSSLDPKAITPALREKVRAKVEADVKRERELTLKAIPEWQNATVRDAELGLMVEYMKDFGIPETYLTTTMSHKLFRMVRHATLQKQRIEKALASVVAVKKPSTTGKSGAGNGAPKKPQASQPKNSGGMQERFRQILSQG